MLMKATDALARSFDLAAETSRAAPHRIRRFRGLRVGNLGLLVPHDCGGEILEDPPIYALPGAASWCRGLINLRGNLLPAFDLHEALGLAHIHTQQPWWLVLGVRDQALAVAVDALPLALTADETAVVQSALIPNSLRPFAGTAYRIGGELWLEFHHRDCLRALASSSPTPHFP
jgi:twitching motility protein PilI